MKFRKYIKSLAVVMTMAIVFTSCGSVLPDKENKESKFQDEKDLIMGAGYAQADDGVYFIDSFLDENNGGAFKYSLLKYIDKKSKKQVPLCQKVNCKHDSEECPAFMSNGKFMDSLLFSNNKLYYTVCDIGESNLTLYSVNKDGSDKKIIHTFKNQMVPPNAMLMYKGKFFISMQVTVEYEDGSGSESGAPSLVMYDTKTKEERIIVDGNKESDKYTIPCGKASENSIYFSQMDFGTNPEEEPKDICMYKEYNFETGEITEIYNGKRDDYQMVKNDIIYLYSKENHTVDSYNLKTKETKNILSDVDKDVTSVFFYDGEFLQLEKKPDKDFETYDDLLKETMHNYYDLNKNQYLFDEDVTRKDVSVKALFDEDYWLYKGDKSYFYNLKDKEFKEIKDRS